MIKQNQSDFKTEKVKLVFKLSLSSNYTNVFEYIRVVCTISHSRTFLIKLSIDFY